MEHHEKPGGLEDVPGPVHEEDAVHGSSGTDQHEHGSAGGIEWEDDMVEINKLTATANVHWLVCE
jgi:hypothetical protein